MLNPKWSSFPREVSWTDSDSKVKSPNSLLTAEEVRFLYGKRRPSNKKTLSFLKTTIRFRSTFSQSSETTSKPPRRLSSPLIQALESTDLIVWMLLNLLFKLKMSLDT